jgi:DNA repair photolyase
MAHGDLLPRLDMPQKGRGATQNHISTRFGLNEIVPDGDWLDACEAIDGLAPPPRSTVTLEHPKSILTFNQSPDIPFDRSVNAYRGCEHGCVYCYARPTHVYHDLSPGLDFETKLFAKPDAAEILRKTISKTAYQVAPIAIGTNTDPYQPIESRYRITRQILELMLETCHPIAITTKSARILDDLDLLVPLAQRELLAVAISITTLDKALVRILEPRATTPMKRLEAVKILAENGIVTHVNVAPVIPAITDHEIEHIVEASAQAGAASLSWIPLRLPHEVAPLFRDWLDAHFVDRAEKVMHIVQDMRGGKDNDPDFFARMRGSGAWAQLTRDRFRIAKKRHNMEKSAWNMRTDLFTPPSLSGQMSLF